MPDYRKKRHSKIFSAPKPRRQKSAEPVSDSENIKMSPAEKYRKTTLNQSMKVVKGKKFEQRRKLKMFVIITAAILVVLGVMEMALPMGVIEGITHTVSLFGAGSYPINLDSSQTINVINRGSHCYVLTDTYLYAFSSSGKTLFSYPHGYENPVLKTSATRALLFDQNGTKACIFTVNGLKSELDTENGILTGSISDSGAYALACRSDKYASAVSVYKRSGKRVYEWYSAQNTVNNVAISPDGKKIAVSAFGTQNGQYKSVLSVLNFKSATAEYTQNYDNSLIYSLEDYHRSSFAVISENSIEFIKWSGYKKQQYQNEYSISMFRPSKSGYVAVFNRKNDKTDNHLAVFSKTGELKCEFSYKGIISDIAISGGHIYCMSETDIYLLGNDGTILRQASCGFGAVRIYVCSSNAVAAVADNKIEKINLEQEDEK